MTEPAAREGTSAPKDSKKAYSAPRLVEYGNIAKLTQSAGATVESGTGMACL